MAQLTDDCFAFSGPLLPIPDMERMIAERVQPVSETETVSLAAARGRVLAADVIAPLDLPPFDNSAVDGYAVRHRDLDPEGRNQARRHRPPDRGQRRGSAARRARGDAHLHRRADAAPAPTPCSCRRTCAPKATPSSFRPASSPAPTGGSPARTCARMPCCFRPDGGSRRRTSRSRPRSG